MRLPNTLCKLPYCYKHLSQFSWKSFKRHKRYSVTWTFTLNVSDLDIVLVCLDMPSANDFNVTNISAKFDKNPKGDVEQKHNIHVLNSVFKCDLYLELARLSYSICTSIEWAKYLSQVSLEPFNMTFGHEIWRLQQLLLWPWHWADWPMLSVHCPIGLNLRAKFIKSFIGYRRYRADTKLKVQTVILGVTLRCVTGPCPLPFSLLG